MHAKTPDDIHTLFEQAFNAGDVDAVIALFEPGAALMPQPGTVVRGHAAVRDALAGFFALRGKIAFGERRSIGTDDLALLYSGWTLTGTGADGNAVELAGCTSDVVRRQPDGRWLLAIDNPYGGAVG